MILNIIGTIILWNLLVSILHQKYNWKSNKVYCGLIGFSGKGKMNLDKIRMLMFWNAVDRGKDSTGIYSPENGLIKTTDAAWKFLLKETIKEDSLFIGHVRASTVGSTITKNAHPFEEGNVILAHNGTLTNYYAIAQKYGIDTITHSVDSHIMAAAFNKAQSFKPLEEFDGAAAFLITNKDTPNVLYAFTNGQRPLFKGIIDGDMYISSIEDSLKMIGCTHIKAFKENTVYTIKEGILVNNGKKIKSNPVKYKVTQTYKGSTVWVDDIEQLERMNIMANRSCSSNFYSGQPLQITLGNFYYVVEGRRSKREFVIVDDTGKERTAPGYLFDYHDCILEKGCNIKLLRNLSSAADKKEETIFKKGDIVEVDTVNFHNHTVSVYSETKKKYYNLDFEYVRRLTKLEEAAYELEQNPVKPNSNESSVNPNLKFLDEANNPFPSLGTEETIEEESDIVLGDDTSLEDEEEEDDTEEGNIVMVNESELNDAFDDIYKDTESILQFGNSIIVDKENLKVFNKMTYDLQGKLMGYVDQFAAAADNTIELISNNNEEEEEDLVNQNHE